MSPVFLKIIIVGLPFGFSLMWFVYWVVKLYKIKEKPASRKASPSSKDSP